MINEKIQCPNLGNINIRSLDISCLFNEYKSTYIKVFNITESKFLRLKTFKESRGGFLIEISSKDGLLALFTLSNAENNFLELGDICKVKFKFSRTTFANALSIGCKRAIHILKKDGIYGYPNNLAKELELLAGFKIFKLYQRSIYLVFLNLKLRLPLAVYNKKTHFKSNYFYKFPLSLIKFKLYPTGLKYLKLRIYKKTNIKRGILNIFYFGFIYEFTVSNNFGDPFIIFGNNEFPINKIDFQYTDNSV